jgi:hypothetical protein
MRFLTDAKPWATIMTAILVGIAAIAGGAAVVFNPESLNFQEYLDVLQNFAIAVGIVGVGRGIASYGKSSAQAAALTDKTLLSAAPGTEDWRIGVATTPAPISADLLGTLGEEDWEEAASPSVSAKDRPPLEG